LGPKTFWRKFEESNEFFWVQKTISCAISPSIILHISNSVRNMSIRVCIKVMPPRSWPSCWTTIVLEDATSTSVTHTKRVSHVGNEKYSNGQSCNSSWMLNKWKCTPSWLLDYVIIGTQRGKTISFIFYCI